MTFTYKVMDRLTKKVLFRTGSFEEARQIVLKQDRGNAHKVLLIIRETI